MSYKSVIENGFFCYATVMEIGLANAATVNPAINISNDARFDCFEIRAVIYKLAAPTGPVLLSMQLANGELFQNTALDLFSIASQNIQNYSGYPIRMPFESKIPKSSQINCQITNNSGADVNVQIQLWGRKCQDQTVNPAA